MSNASSTDSVDTVFAGLRHSLQSGRLAHAYLLVGNPRGKAYHLALRLLTEVFSDAEEGMPGARGAVIDPHRHPDVTWLEPQGRGRVIPIGRIRDLNQRISTTAYAGGWKAGVILHAERMQHPAANAFLKTLEEPPRKSLLLLVTDAPQDLLPTILSRCQRLNVHEPMHAPEGEWTPDLLGLLRKGPPGDPLEACCRAGHLARLVKAEKERIEETVRAEFADEEGDEQVIEARVIARLRESQEDIMRALLLWHRDILVCAVAGPDSALHFPAERDILAGLGGQLTWNTALAGVQAVEEGRARLHRNLPLLAVFEGLFVAQGRAAQEGRKASTGG